MELIKLLVVDDSKTFNNMVSALFQSLGYEVEQAFTLEEAKDKLLEFQIDYIMLDLNLTDGNGEDLIGYVKEYSPNSKIIVMTADENTEYRDRIFEKGIIDYFLKTTPIKVIVNSSHSIIQTLQIHKNSNILTIDDSKFVRGFLKNILESKGYGVVEASDAREGFEALENHLIDLILLDIIMPGIDGIKFLETIKSNPSYFDIPVIVISADQSRDNYARVLKQGANDFIKKPFIVEDVLLKCDIHIKSYSNQKKLLMNNEKLIEQEAILEFNTKQIVKQDEYRRSLLEASVDPFIIISKDGKIVEINSATLQTLGYKREELVDTEIYEYFRKPEAMKQFHNDILEKGKLNNIPLQLKSIEDKIIDIICNASSFVDDKYDKACTFLTLKCS